MAEINENAFTKQRASPLVLPQLPKIILGKSLVNDSNKENTQQPSTSVLLSPTETLELSSSTTAGDKENSTSSSHQPPCPEGRLVIRKALSVSNSNDFLNTSSSSHPSPFGLNQPEGLKRNRILRYGETVESFFGWHEESSEEYKSACLFITKGENADAPSAWKRVLELSRTETKSGFDFTRLYRRAMSRFDTDPSNPHATEILSLWLLYAQAQVKVDSLNEALLIIKQVERLGKNCSYFYATWAEIEHSLFGVVAAHRVLEEGLQNKAQPINVLQEAFERLLSNSPTSTKESPKKKNVTSISNNKPNFVSDAIEHPDRINNSLLSLEPNSLSQNSEASGSKESIRFKLAPLPRPLFSLSNAPSNLIAPTPTQPTHVITLNEDLKRVKICTNNVETSSIQSTDFAKHIISSASITQQTTPSREEVQIKSTRVTSVDSKKRRLHRPPLLNKTPRFNRLNVSLGKAQRVDPQSSMCQFDSDDTEQFSENTKEEPLEKRPSRKITKLDLSYMWEWDPNKRNDKDDDAQLRQSKSPSLGRIDEASLATRSTSDSANSLSASMHSKTLSNKIKSSEKSTPSVSKHSSCDEVSSEENDQYSSKTQKDQTSTDNVIQSALIAKVNTDFLPLVYEENVIRVNDAPYVKLGVIGKGGSCKVYRALSRDCSVVAIKRVKLSGMDKKAIEGYSNEIALLKRLRGSPAIIQMFDSEVDLRRKSIFLVMEVGEVDLNHVLLQQNHHVRTDKPGLTNHLNMNFIRLTWQQMLQAVHCIHEERIIHGDLKPANFLFVRGSLKLIDFGIAKAMQSDDTTNIYRETQIGTLNYMSPEAILDTGTGKNGARMKMGRASDIWSLGCILYQMIYGKTPFADLQMLAKLQAIVNPLHTIEFPNTVDLDALDVMRCCLNRSPEERPPIVGIGGLLNEHPFLNSHRS